MLLEGLKIKDLYLKNKLILAPMAGITDMTFRLLCKSYGASLVFTEMVSAKGLHYSNEKTRNLLSISPEERPIGVQLFGSEPEILGQIAEEISLLDIDLIDINMGCPAPKIVNLGQGAALMKDPKRVKDIVDSVVRKTSKPVSVKIRKGWDKNNINALEIAKIIEDSGASALTIHGRTREEFYQGKADWDIIAEIKNNLKIPVIGNGDVFSGKTAKAMLDKTGCDGIMIGRGVQGRPWIFHEIMHFFETGEHLDKYNGYEKIDMALYHLKKNVELKGDKTGVMEMRKHISWYLKGLDNANIIKDKINRLLNVEDIEETLLNYRDSLI